MFVVVYADTRQGFQLQHHPIARMREARDGGWMEGNYILLRLSNQYYRNRRQTSVTVFSLSPRVKSNNQPKLVVLYAIIIKIIPIVSFL